MRLLTYALLLIFLTSSLGSIYAFVKRADLAELEWQSASHGDVYGVPPSGPQMTGFAYQGKQLTV